MNIPMRFGRASVGPKGPAPQIGEHSAEVLSDFGIEKAGSRICKKPESWEMPTTDHMNVRKFSTRINQNQSIWNSLKARSEVVLFRSRAYAA